MAQLDKTKSAYLAGFLDGDGCISVKFEKRSKYSRGFVLKPVLSFTQHTRNRLVLENIKDWIDDGCLNDYSNKNVSELVVRKKETIKNVLVQVSPYVIVKKQQLKLMLEMLALPIFRGQQNDELFTKAYIIAKQIRDLNLTPKKYQVVPLSDPVTTDQVFLKKELER
ncbi:hypothetical protein COT93_01710 [Candidatus Falkowbacteria bacterium CG10_big_fil_rev_8_21_14_0_10_37_18]|uniref:Homing endonuclease LAGLIDADG domain-containing protein n=1 Tax=Candidatus Falkowbacteria bacterium CG10_big_fil_rev_8_21_14_0_10_37_18 TaxID=1974562 RepID=A0A2H0V8X8_9BACT|nr:MAG: hypothetical protein COT93_01710 [Candidatus Falkowbacteria bacterium CG10_big_fil_rev_8_21_14_0_10_37_18]